MQVLYCDLSRSINSQFEHHPHLFLLPNAAGFSGGGTGEWRSRCDVGHTLLLFTIIQATITSRLEPPGLCDMTMPTQQLAFGGCLLVEATHLRLAKSVTFGELEECGTQLGNARSIWSCPLIQSLTENRPLTLLTTQDYNVSWIAGVPAEKQHVI